MSDFTQPIEHLMVLATHNAEVAAQVVTFTDEEFDVSPHAEMLVLFRDFLRVALMTQPLVVTANSLRVYRDGLKISHYKKLAFTALTNRVLMAYWPSDDNATSVCLWLKQHAESAKIARAKAKLTINPYEAIRELRELGFDDKKLDNLKRALARKHQRMSTLSILGDTTINEETPIIDGIVRRGEVCNVVAAPKARKSWLVHGLAISLEHGIPWLGFNCKKSRVLIIDNELRMATIKKRMSTIYAGMGVRPTGTLEIEAARGRSLTILDIPELVAGGSFDVIILDALYRFFPPGFDENSNANMTRLYNDLDEVATETGAAIFVVHHASKGGQSQKSITDVGSGAGAQSRAADAHLILRPQKQDADTATEETATLDMVTRSFAPTDRIFLKWQYPQWVRQATAEVTYQDNKAIMTPEMFAQKYFNPDFEPKSAVFYRAETDGMSERTFNRQLALAFDRKLVDESRDPQNPRRKLFRRHHDQPF